MSSIGEGSFNDRRWTANGLGGILERGRDLTVLVPLLLLVILIVSVLAPWLGTDTSDGHSEPARPDQGWFPLVTRPRP